MEPTIHQDRGNEGPEPDLHASDAAAEAGRPGATIRPPAPGAQRERWRPSNLTLRLLTAAALIPPLIWACYEGGPVFVGVVVLVSVLGVHEFFNFIAAKGAVPARLIGTVAAALLPLVVWIGDALYATSLMTVALLGVMILQLAKREIREAIVSVSATFFGVVYVGWMMSHAVSVRFIQRDLVRRYGESAAVAIPEQIGFFFIVLCLVIAVGCDTGAYFAGRAWGRRKLAPTISPNKTVEGAVGGVIMGTALAVVTKLVFDYLVPGELSLSFGLVACVSVGLAVASMAVLGDLAESLLKRDADMKDAGNLLPGVGGVLDRIDSTLFAAPVTYYLLLAYYSAQFGW